MCVCVCVCVYKKNNKNANEMASDFKLGVAANDTTDLLKSRQQTKHMTSANLDLTK